MRALNRFLDRHLYPVWGKYILFVGIISFLVGIYGAISYSNVSYDEKYAKEAECLVLNTAIVKLRCGNKNTATCYQPTWIVSYDIGNDNETATIKGGSDSSQSSAENDLQKYQIGKQYQCWYDSNNHDVAIWSIPTAKTPTILMAVFFSLGGVLIVGLIGEMIIRKNRREGEEYNTFAYEQE